MNLNEQGNFRLFSANGVLTMKTGKRKLLEQDSGARQN